MITISRMALIATITAAGIASPALAQSFDPEAGSGNVAGFSYPPSPAENDEFAVRQSSHAKTAARQNGLHAFATVPGTSSNSSSNNPAFTGGGSAGYDQMLQRY
jgi:ABC-type sugar transport system substrate-binding protein